MDEDSEDERDPDWLKEKTVKVGLQLNKHMKGHFTDFSRVYLSLVLYLFKQLYSGISWENNSDGHNDVIMSV